MATTVYFNSVVDGSLQTVLNWFSDSTGLVPLTRLPHVTEAIEAVVGSGAVITGGTLVVASADFTGDCQIGTGAGMDISITAAGGITLDGVIVESQNGNVSFVGPITCVNSPNFVTQSGGNITFDLMGGSAATFDPTSGQFQGLDPNHRLIVQNFTGTLDFTNATSFSQFVRVSGAILFGDAFAGSIEASGCVTGSVTNTNTNGIAYGASDSGNPGTINGTFTDTSSGLLENVIVNGPTNITTLSSGYQSNGGMVYNGLLTYTTVAANGGQVPPGANLGDTFNGGIVVKFTDSDIVYFDQKAINAGALPGYGRRGSNALTLGFL